MSDIYNLSEATLGYLKKRQEAEITKLFPKFYSRVEDVRLNGGIRMIAEDDGSWTFQVKSVSEEIQKWYTVKVLFKNVDLAIQMSSQNRDLWKKDGSGVDLRKLAAAVLYDVDIKIKCQCPADLFWGQQYIRSRKPAPDANIFPDENRPPDVRNPRQLGVFCKHEMLLINLLPMYQSTFTKWLQKYHLKDVKTGEREERKDATAKGENHPVKQEPKPEQKGYKTEAERRAKEKTSESISESRPKSKYRIIGSRECWIIQELVNGEWQDLKDPDGQEHSSFVTKWEAQLYLKYKGNNG